MRSFYRSFLVAILLLIGLSLSLGPAVAKAHPYGNVWLNDNEALVLNAVTELFVNKNVDAVDQYWSPNYIQRDPFLPNGTAPLKNFTALSSFTYETGFIVSNGPVVAIRSRITPVNRTGNISLVVDIYRVQGNKIVEHWSVAQDEVPVNRTVSGLPMFDPQEHHSYNLSQCWNEGEETRNMLQARWGLHKLFNMGDLAFFDRFWDRAYLQHNPGVASGSDQLRPNV
ncbi:hypothetical protein M427DRAFT_154881 [Gonapodya prolifera JEL478]|uniref:SnoaL-like domain-containing protein n=1 Tax=Gonapodya prolifera (strain JEL478) TaxID=1344416 RepID=A0A139AHG9_GONPJ|nr:hypothetical protein M427DRAFT_154881 [Gonapodya prolifera JEL478]|eukprot:KXS16178.1 hypothetical protein M427DRAFT_154881 [Gonapodya prolifera JEL478]